VHRWCNFGENVWNTLQDVVLTMFQDAHTEARTDAGRKEQKPLCFQKSYAGRRHKNYLKVSTTDTNFMLYFSGQCSTVARSPVVGDRVTVCSLCVQAVSGGTSSLAAQFSDVSALEVCIHVMRYTNRHLFFTFFTSQRPNKPMYSVRQKSIP